MVQWTISSDERSIVTAYGRGAHLSAPRGRDAASLASGRDLV